MKNQSEKILPNYPNFILGPRPWGERVLSFINPIPKMFRLKNERKAMVEACSNGNIEKVQYLINRVGGLNWRDSEQSAPLHVAIQKQHVEIVELLLKSGANVMFNSSLMIQDHICFPGIESLVGKSLPQRFSILKLLIDHGLSKKINHRYGQRYSNTLLHFAVTRENPKDIVQLLLEHGANPFIENKAMDTPFSLASKSIQELITVFQTQKDLNKNLPQTKLDKKNKPRL